MYVSANQSLGEEGEGERYGWTAAASVGDKNESRWIERVGI